MIPYRQKWDRQIVSVKEERKNIDYLNMYFKDIPFTPEEKKALMNLAALKIDTVKKILTALKKAYTKNPHHFTSEEGSENK